MSYCLYFRAQIRKDRVWFLTSILRGCEHLAFDRAFDVKNNIFEFFVSPDSEAEFLSLMRFFEKKQIVSDFKQLPNRLHGDSYN